MKTAIEEHLDHVAGCATEHQNCHAQSQIENNARESATAVEIAMLTALGLHVAVEVSNAYCRVTDGIVGARTRIMGAFPTKGDAEAFIAMYADRYYDGESIYQIHSPLPKPKIRAKENPLPPETSREREEAERNAEEAESHGIDMDDDIPF